MEDPAIEVHIRILHWLLIEKIVGRECHSVCNVLRELNGVDDFGPVLDHELERWEFSYYLNAHYPVGPTNINHCTVLDQIPIEALEDMTNFEAWSGLEVFHGIFEAYGTFRIPAQLFVDFGLCVMC